MIATTELLLEDRVDALSWGELTEQLDARGFAITPEVLSPGECADLAALFDEGRFRSTIEMARHRFGDGRYRYFDHPLPEAIGRAADILLRSPGAGRQRLVGAAAG